MQQAQRSAFCRYALGVALLFLLAPAQSQQSYFRLYDQTSGLNVGEIAALAQDDAGFIWVGAHRGLVRFDGRNFVAWAPDKLDELVNHIVHGPADELIVGSGLGHAWRKTDTDLEALAGPDGAPIADLVSVDFDRGGALWAILGQRLWRRDHSGRWQHADVGIGDNEVPRLVRALGDSVVVLTDQAAWRVRDGAAAQRILQQPRLWSVAGSGDGVFWLVTHGGRLWRVDAQGAREVSVPASRVLDLRMRGKTLWLALDTMLLAIEADGRIRRMDGRDGLPSGGPLLIDRENSLWLGSFIGLLQFPEPDTWHWSLREGLPSAHAHNIAAAEGAIWVSTWGNGLVRIDPVSGELHNVEPTLPDGDICALGEHGVWALDGTHLLRWQGTRFAAVAELATSLRMASCLIDGAGAIWFATDKNLLRVVPGAGSSEATPQVDSIALDHDETADVIWLDGTQIYMANSTHICQLIAKSPQAAHVRDCVPTGSSLYWDTPAQIAPHRTWLAAHDGLYEFDGTRLQRLRSNHQINGGMIQSLKPSRDGAWWAAGAGVLERIQPCTSCAADWQEVETPGLWQGLPGNAALDALETAEGDLWLAGNRGVWRIPHSVRSLSKPAPTIALVRAQIDADVHSLQTAIELQPQQHRLELEFAALSFRDRSLLRYRSRIGDDAEWSAPSHESRLQFAALEPGNYHAQMSASVDGEHWSSEPAEADFTVLPPWYRTLWARALFALAILALLVLIYRLRVAALLRAESERTRIAMDLHDEIGAGLGSIGMLAGSAARLGADPVEQQRIVGEIANVSNLLGSGLRSLVWSMRSGNAGLSELAQQIADHARRLFPGEQPHLSLRLPAPSQASALPAQVRRHVLLFALEALHNVARHAHAQNVDVSFETIGSVGFSLHIDDDGCGFDSQKALTGNGLESMQRRARAIHATLDIVSTPGRGTRIVLGLLDAHAAQRLSA